MVTAWQHVYIYILYCINSICVSSSGCTLGSFAFFNTFPTRQSSFSIFYLYCVCWGLQWALSPFLKCFWLIARPCGGKKPFVDTHIKEEMIKAMNYRKKCLATLGQAVVYIIPNGLKFTFHLQEQLSGDIDWSNGGPIIIIIIR